MIFKQAQEVVDGRKRQTRRPVKPGEWAEGIPGYPAEVGEAITAVYDGNGRLKWQVGKDYAAQPGRGKKSIGRTPPVVEIRRERLQEISYKDCLAEGIRKEDLYQLDRALVPYKTAAQAFADLWNSIYGKPDRWGANPDVWVLVFEGVDD